jgi:hypothetical protein
VRTIDALQAMIMGSPGSPDTRYGLAGGSSASSSQTSVSAVLSGMVSGVSSGGRQWQCGKEPRYPGYHAVLAEGAVQYKRCQGWRRRCLMYEAFSTWQLAKRNVAAQVAAVKKNQVKTIATFRALICDPHFSACGTSHGFRGSRFAPAFPSIFACPRAARVQPKSRSC